jgi:two-component system OmpR family sensor kinase
MTLRTKLILAFTGLVLIVISLVGVVAVRSTRRVLLNQIEDRLLTASATDVFPALGRDQQPVGRTLAVVILGSNGEVLRSFPSGLPGRFDPLPDASGIDDIPLRRGRLFTLPAVTGGEEYRALAAEAPDGRVFVIAHTLRDVAAAEAALTRRLLTGGGLVLLFGIGAVWLTVRSGLQPVEKIIDTAMAIAAGDLSQRVPDADPGTELGRLGTSLNEMLASVEIAFVAENRANERLKQFVADASHELRTPLAAISGYAELDRRGALSDPTERERVMRRIESETKRMGRLVEDLMFLARLDLGDQAGAMLVERRVDLAAIARDAVADHHAIDPDRPVNQVGLERVVVYGDGERLTQVVANLLANLRVHTPPGTAATLTLTDSDGWVEASLADTGQGFPADALPLVFDRFYRADPSRSRRSGGSGLGLAIVAAIVEAHSGTVQAVNDHGAVITFRIPSNSPGPNSRPALS